MYARLRLGGLVLLAVLATVTLTACRPAADKPQITHVRPSIAAPGSLVLVSGRDFKPADIVWLNGQPAAQVTWVNAQLLTAVVPAGLTAGAYPLEVRSLDGVRAAASLNVGGPATAPVAEVASSPAPAAAPTGPAPPVQPAPSQPPAATTARPQAPPPAAVSSSTTADQQQAEERQREAQKKAEERLREEQKKAEERQREAEKQRQEDEKKRQEQPRR